jgi:hypothetical protein
MKLQEKTNDITSKIAKGFVDAFAIKLALFVFIFTFQACSPEDTSDATVTGEEFTKALELTTFNLIHDIELSNVTGMPNKKRANKELLYLVRQQGQKLLNTDFTNSIRNLEDLVMARDAYGLEIRTSSQFNDISKNEVGTSSSDVVAGEPVAVEEPVSVYEMDEQTAIATLEPMIPEARAYFESKGFTPDEIDAMIAEYGGTEYDLVLVVAVLTELENNPPPAADAVDATAGEPGAAEPVATTQQNELTWAEIRNCAIIAIGADVLWALGTSNAKTWSKAAIKKAFKTAAQKALGPIGVAIALVSFGICLLNESQD